MYLLCIVIIQSIFPFSSVEVDGLELLRLTREELSNNKQWWLLMATDAHSKCRVIRVVCNVHDNRIVFLFTPIILRQIFTTAQLI